MSKVLLVEDDILLGQELKEWLEEEDGFTVELVNAGEDALQLLASFSYQLVILDWDLPGISGLSVCNSFRKTGGQTPILFLTGRSSIDDKKSGFEQGADDYLPKPFNIQELSLRCRALLRRARQCTVLDVPDKQIALRPSENVLRINDRDLSLTRMECAVLKYLMSNPGQRFSAMDLLKSVWPSEKQSSEEAVRALIKALRKKLSSVGDPVAENLIKSGPGGGYSFDCTEN